MHLQALYALVLTGLSTASPAPQQLDLNQIQDAAAVQTAPFLNGFPAQTATLIASVEVFSAVAASSTVAPTAPVQARNVEKPKRHVLVGIENGVDVATGDAVSIVTNVTALTIGVVSNAVEVVAKVANAAIVTAIAAPVYVLCFVTFGIACPSTGGGSSATIATAPVVVVGSSTIIAASSTTTASSAYTPYYPATSTISRSATGSVSSGAACSTAIETGTYCGFINPEDPCAPQPDGYGPVSTPDTVSAFYAYKPFHSMASAAPLVISASAASPSASIPPNIPQVYLQTFRDLNGSSSANSYIGLYTLQKYDAVKCASLCDQTSLCTAFNIYIERDPSQNPCNNDSTAPTVWGYNCPNPASMTSYKCTLWGSELSASTATNMGGYREQFHVVITGSNGYDKTNDTIPITPIGNSTNNSPWSSSPKSCGQKAMNSPQNWMGSRFFPGPFNPQLCSDFAIAQNYQNKADAMSAGKSYYQPCNMFNAYYLLKNGLPWGTYCALYDTDISVGFATYAGATLDGDHFEVSKSFTWTLQTSDNGYF